MTTNPSSYLGQQIQVGDTVAWAVAQGTSGVLRIGEVVDIDGQKLRCSMYTRGRNTVEARSVVHTPPPDFRRAIGKRTGRVGINTSRAKKPSYGDIEYEQDLLITGYDDGVYYARWQGVEYPLTTGPIEILQRAK